MQKKKLLFVHIPKCGGTSFKSVLYDIFGFENVLKIWDPNFGATASIEGFLNLDLEEIRAYPCIAGHIEYPLIRKKLGKEILAEYKVCSIVRDPVSKFLSLWNYSIQNPNIPNYKEITKMSIEDYASYTTNQQCRFICGEADAELALKTIQSEYDFVFTLNNFQQAVNEICQEFDHSLKENTVKNKSVTIISEKHLSQATKECIKSQNKQDEILYQAIANTKNNITLNNAKV
jgi:hypothetical protein